MPPFSPMLAMDKIHTLILPTLTPTIPFPRYPSLDSHRQRLAATAATLAVGDQERKKWIARTNLNCRLFIFSWLLVTRGFWTCRMGKPPIPREKVRHSSIRLNYIPDDIFDIVTASDAACLTRRRVNTLVSSFRGVETCGLRRDD
jgi:hypothetical protein